MTLPLDPLIARLNELERRIAHLEANAEASAAGGDADTVDGFHAAAVPLANALLALNGSGVFPADVVDFATLTADAQVWATVWTNDTLWFLPSDANWNSDSQSTLVNPRRRSTVVVLGAFRWTDYTASRIDAVQFRWRLGTTAGPATAWLGCSVNFRFYPTVHAVFSGVPAGSQTLVLQAQKNSSYINDGMWVDSRRVTILYVPED